MTPNGSTAVFARRVNSGVKCLVTARHLGVSQYYLARFAAPQAHRVEACAHPQAGLDALMKSC